MKSPAPLARGFRATVNDLGPSSELTHQTIPSALSSFRRSDADKQATRHAASQLSQLQIGLLLTTGTSSFPALGQAMPARSAPTRPLPPLPLLILLLLAAAAAVPATSQPIAATNYSAMAIANYKFCQNDTVPLAPCPALTPGVCEAPAVCKCGRVDFDQARVPRGLGLAFEPCSSCHWWPAARAVPTPPLLVGVQGVERGMPSVPMFLARLACLTHPALHPCQHIRG